MTHDELVKFAAEKVGVTVKNKTLFSHVEGDKDIYTHEWFEVDEQDEIEDYFDLTSPDLFFKGLAVYYREGAPFQISPWGVKLGFQNMAFDTIDRIPEKFWECWAEVEGKGKLTKEGV